MIYEPTGRAREYSALALNLYAGCTHGCTYCYVPRIVRGADMQKGGSKKSSDFFVKLSKQLSKWPHSMAPRVLLCFTTDPYHAGDTKDTATAINILHDNGFRVSVLSKGGLRSLRDISMLTREDQIGCTLTTLNNNWQRREPGAASPTERIEALSIAKKSVSVFVSIEPVMDAQEGIDVAHECAKHFSDIRIGHWSGDPRSSGVDWKRLYEKTKHISGVFYKHDVCKAVGILYTPPAFPEFARRLKQPEMMF